jgi:mxaJ protein
MSRLRTLLLVAACAVAPGLASAGNWELRVCADPDNLPFSNKAGEGFDDRIAAIIAEELGADLTRVFLPDTRGRTRQRYVQGAECDLVMGVLDGQPGFLTSYAYYRTGYVFLYPENAPFEVTSLDDEVLKTLRIGVPGGIAKLVPPSLSLEQRGIVDNQIHFIDRRDPGQQWAPILNGLKDDKIDLAIAWGPIAGAYAKSVPGLVVTPVSPEIDAPFIPMIASLAIGFRPGDEGLRDDVDDALARGWDRIQAVLTEAGVPLIDLPAPVESVGGNG